MPSGPTSWWRLDDVIDQKLDAIHELESQLYEGGALGSEEEFRLVPKDPTLRKAWFKKEHYWAKATPTSPTNTGSSS